MTFKHLAATLVLAPIVGWTPEAFAQVETSPVIEESRPVRQTPAPSTLGPRRHPLMFGTGVAATAVGGTALTLGALMKVAQFGQAFGCAAKVGQECPHDPTSLEAPASILLISGVVLLVAGIPMIVVSAKRLPKAVAFDELVIRF